jgi:outer membrane receptor for ferrienterochelin and colicins
VGLTTVQDARALKRLRLTFADIGLHDMSYSNAALAVIGLSLCTSIVLPCTAQAADADSNINIVDHDANDAAADIAAPVAGSASATTAPSASTATTGTGGSLSEIVVVATRLNAERSEIETQTGASITTIDATAIAAMPGGANVQLNQIMLQAPDVIQDSFGQIHVRGDHNDLQYRLNGIILPEGISVFSQTLDPRLISSMSLITGALPAEYGLRTAGIIDLTTKSGLMEPGGSVTLYGGSHSTLEPSAWVGGSAGNFSYFASASMLRNDLGIESPDATSEPLHDHSTQFHGFGYFEDIIDPDDRLTLILSASSQQFQIPNQHGLESSLGLDDEGVTDYLSNNLNESQHELTQYAILSWQHSQGAFKWQSSLSSRYTSLDFEPDWVGDLLFNGIAQNAFKGDTALAWQTDSAYELSDTHTLRAGFYLQHDTSTSDTTSQVLPVSPVPQNAFYYPAGLPISDIPEVVTDNGSQTQTIESVYLQDEWKAFSTLTINYGLRFDAYHGYSSGSQLSPRLNAVWEPLPGTTIHGGYSRYFTPPPFELVGSETFTRFANTTAAPPGAITQDTAPIAERADYYDFGLQQKLLAKTLTMGVDGFWRTAQNLIDEGQFGAPVILTPFNYRYGEVGGIEFTGNYTTGNFSSYGNLAIQSVKGKDVESSQFNFTAQELSYIADNYIHLDHEERVSASGGVSYLLLGTRLNLDMIFGTGLRQDLQLVAPSPTVPFGVFIPNGDHTPSYTQWNFGMTHAFQDGARGPLTARFDVVNLFDKIYEIRSGNGVGVFAPQFGARRGLFFGLTQDF